MPTTRSFISLGVWAEDAQTVIPSEPTPGEAYRNTALTPEENQTGEKFQTKANSTNINQKMFIISSFTDTIDKHGVPGWSDQVDYAVPAIVWADDGEYYYARQDSGPSTLPRDPVGSPLYWFKYSQELAPYEGTRFIGHTNFTLASFVPFAWCEVSGNAGYETEFNMGASNLNGIGDITITFDTPQPDNLYGVSLGIDSRNTDTSKPYSVNIYSKTTTGVSFKTWDLSGIPNLSEANTYFFFYPSTALIP